MPQYLAPGVYVEEIAGPKPIEPVGTATGGFVGIAERGPIGEAVLVTSWTQFVETFGGYTNNGYLAYAVNQFFTEHGTKCYVVRTCHYSDITDAKSKGAELATLTLKDRAGTPANTLRIDAKNEGAWGNQIAIVIEEASKDKANKFKLVVLRNGKEVESFDGLSVTDVEAKARDSKYIKATNLKSATAAPTNLPALSSSTLTGGDDGLQSLADSDFIGDAGARNGLFAFDVVDDVNILAIPDRPGDREVTIAAYTYCQNRGDCFFVADPPEKLTPQQVLGYKEGTLAPYEGSAFNSSYAALYYPWIHVVDPLSDTGATKAVPPSGAVIGTYSYTDVTRGVHKAPAGINEGNLNSAVGVERPVSKGEQELLNPEGINVIRSFPGAGICVWGARTLSADSEWKYVNVRRLLLSIEESIEEGTQWVVFEPNDRSLWGKVRRDTTAFLSVVWQSGALFGATAQEAFFVKVDDENNPPEMRDLGRLIIDVGVAPVKPAEFVVFRITQMVQGKKA